MTRPFFMSLVMCSLASGCGGPADELANVIAVSADISDYQEVQFAAIGGFVTASGTLTFTDDAGGGHSVPVGVGGPIVGMIFDFHTYEEDMFFEGSGGASLSIPEGGVPVPALFEPYTGSGGAGSIGLGGAQHELENESGVGLDMAGLGVGVGMMVAVEWFSITPESEVR